MRLQGDAHIRLGFGTNALGAFRLKKARPSNGFYVHNECLGDE